VVGEKGAEGLTLFAAEGGEDGIFDVGVSLGVLVGPGVVGGVAVRTWGWRSETLCSPWAWRTMYIVFGPAMIMGVGDHRGLGEGLGGLVVVRGGYQNWGRLFWSLNLPVRVVNWRENCISTSIHD
jgi:hypothetical protein